MPATSLERFRRLVGTRVKGFIGVQGLGCRVVAWEDEAFICAADWGLVKTGRLLFSGVFEGFRAF